MLFKKVMITLDVMLLMVLGCMIDTFSTANLIKVFGAMFLLLFSIAFICISGD